jgi:hypothetical protein
MRDKEQQQMQKLQKNGLGAANSSLDPLLAVLVQVKTCRAELAMLSLLWSPRDAAV